MKLKLGVILFIVLVLITYPMFYFSYKFSDPVLGMQDYFDYYDLYKNWDLSGTDSPFNTRIISSYIVHLFYSFGFGYETEITNTFGDKNVYFSAILTSYLSVLVASTYMFKIVWSQFKRIDYSIAAVFLFLFSFGTIFWSMGAGNDGFGIMLIAMGYYYYRKKSIGLILILLISLFQREFVFVVFGALAFFDIIMQKENRRYYLTTGVVAVLGMVIYVVLRNTLYDTGSHLDQVTTSGLLEAFSHFHIDGAFIKQVVLTQNILFLYLLFLLMKYFTKEAVCMKSLMQIIFLILVSFGIIFLGRLDTSGGRFIYMLYPILIFQLVTEINGSKTFKRTV